MLAKWRFSYSIDRTTEESEREFETLRRFLLQDDTTSRFEKQKKGWVKKLRQGKVNTASQWNWSVYRVPHPYNMSVNDVVPWLKTRALMGESLIDFSIQEVTNDMVQIIGMNRCEMYDISTYNRVIQRMKQKYKYKRGIRVPISFTDADHISIEKRLDAYWAIEMHSDLYHDRKWNNPGDEFIHNIITVDAELHKPPKKGIVNFKTFIKSKQL